MLKEFTKYTNIQELCNKYVVIFEHNNKRYGYVSNIQEELPNRSFKLYLCSSCWCSSYPHTIINIPTYCLGNTVRIYYDEKSLPCVYTGEFKNNNLKGDNKMMTAAEYDAMLHKIYCMGFNYVEEDNRKTKSPDIIDHSFDGHKTTIKWSDNTTTTCYCKRDDADPYTGFYIACAKKFMGNGNKVNNLAEKWIEKIPKQKAKAKAKADEIAEREKRIEANKKKRREKNRIRLEAIKIKQEYEAKKLANEKYGVPMDFKAEERKG